MCFFFLKLLVCFPEAVSTPKANNYVKSDGILEFAHSHFALQWLCRSPVLEILDPPQSRPSTNHRVPVIHPMVLRRKVSISTGEGDTGGKGYKISKGGTWRHSCMKSAGLGDVSWNM